MRSRSLATLTVTYLAVTLTASALAAASPAAAAPFPIVTGTARSAAGTVRADTYVNSARPFASFGRSNVIRVGSSDTSTRDGLIEVTLPAVPRGARHVRAVLTVTGAGSGGLLGIAGGGPFTERRVTWNTRPAIAGDPFDTVVVPSSGDASLDLTSALPSDGAAISVSLALVPTEVTDADITVASRESRTPPRVLVTWTDCHGVTDTLMPDCQGQTLFGAGEGQAENPTKTRLQAFRDAEARYGRSIPVWRLTVKPTELPFEPGTDTTEAAVAQIADGGIVQMNWKPSPDWSRATGTDPATNAAIDHAAVNIKNSGGRVMLTVFQEPDDNIGGGTTCTVKGTIPGNTPANYVAMWRYVHDRFADLGVNNVVWAMNYQGTPSTECSRIEMWPGDDYVDVVGFSRYWGSKNAPTVASSIGRTYSWFMTNSAPGHAFASKPFALMETGMNNSTASQQVAYTGYADLAAAITNSTYPNLRLVMAWDCNEEASKNTRTDLDGNNVADPAEQSAFKSLVSVPTFQVSPIPAL